LAAEVADIAISAPIYKQRFLRIYRKASARGARSKNLISGFLKTRIWPIDRNKILNDPEAIIEPEAAPPTPQRTPDPPELAFWATPRKSQDLYHFQDLLDTTLGKSRDLRVVLTKVGRALDSYTNQVAELNKRLQRQAQEIEA
jgi:hypothetical protein